MNYALIERNSGFLWAVVAAESPISACKLADQELSPAASGEYWETYSRGDWEYAVYEVPAGTYEDADGQDQAVIDEIGALPVAAYIGSRGAI